MKGDRVLVKNSEEIEKSMCLAPPISSLDVGFSR